MSSTVPKAGYKVVYSGVNITDDISNHLIDIEYCDKVAGEVDEVIIKLEDKAGRWRNEWYPQNGDSINVTLNDGVNDLPCGDFQVDEIELEGAPDIMIIRAVSGFMTKPLRTKRSVANENTTLKQIINKIAAKHGFTVVGDIADVTIGRSTQNRESDLGYLARLALTYGYVFNMKGKQMVFTSVYKLENSDQVFTIDRTDISNYRLKDKVGGTYKNAEVSYHNPAKNTLVKSNYDEQILQNKDDVEYVQITADDTHKVYTRTENKQQADLQSKAALHAKNSLQREGSFNMPGTILALSGNNFLLTGMGVLSGKQHILESRHKITKQGGYDCSVTFKGIAVTTQINQQDKQK